MTVESIALLIALVLMAVTVLLGLLLLQEIRKQKPQFISRPAARPRPIPVHPSSNPHLDFTAPHPLKTRLMAMVGGHHPTADRLLTQVVRDNPGRSLDWYYDRVIQDLIRDRR
jgi:hypothetical protein